MTAMKQHTIIAFAGEDERYEQVVDYAARRASATDARLVLYDIDAAGLQAPLPTVWSAEGTKEHFESGLLTAEMLEGLGRNEFARQVSVIAAKGIDTFGWLPEHANVDDLVAYAEELGADLIVVPEHSDHRALTDMLRGRDTDDLPDRTDIAVAVVDEKGEVAA